MESKILKVMIVDDDNTCLILTAITIESYFKNSQVRIFFDALSALDYLKSSDDNYPDILISDFQMPDMNGLELIDHINEFFRIQYNSPLPFRIMLYSGFLEFNQICAKDGNRKNTSCLLRHLYNGGGLPCSKLPITACMRKPINKDMLNYIMDNAMMKVTQ